MTHTFQPGGCGLTRSGDRRVTTVGRLLRKSKIDELPQLFNVICGDMSLVGPRPDLPEFLDTLDAQYAAIIQIRPGITGWASLRFRNEEELLQRIPEQDVVRYYITDLLPQKVHLDLGYASTATFVADCKVLLETFTALLT